MALTSDVEARPRLAKTVVADYLNSLPEFIPLHPTADDIYVVWFCKTLQNWKALVSTDIVDTGIYFEVTYNGDADEVYLDHYKKVVNKKIRL